MACHAEGRGFESRRSRQSIHIYKDLAGTAERRLKAAARFMTVLAAQFGRPRSRFCAHTGSIIFSVLARKW